MSNKKYNFYAFCQESHLPEDGWIHACISCEKPTSKFILYRKDEYKNEVDLYQIILCFHCKKYYEKNKDEYIKLFNYINRKYDIESNIN